MDDQCIEIVIQPFAGKTELYDRECAAEYRVVLSMVWIGFGGGIRGAGKDRANKVRSQHAGWF
jgi:hypothetical protein